MNKEKYYVSYNNSHVLYKATSLHPEIRYAEACREIVDEKIIEWAQKLTWIECGSYPNNYVCYGEEIPFRIKMVKGCVMIDNQQIKKPHKDREYQPLTYTLSETLSWESVVKATIQK